MLYLYSMENRYKYPKTLHLPWSPGVQNDDRLMPMAAACINFEGNDVVITEKMDGENTTMYRDTIHARSVYSGDHPSRSWVKALHGQIKHEIPDGWRIVGENCYAHHSVFYDDLETYFYVFAIYNEQNICLSWDDTLYWCGLLELTPVRQLARGVLYSILQIQDWVSVDETKMEGYVVRNTKEFHYSEFQLNVAKYVRKNHIQTDEHWMNKPVVKNLLK